MKNLLFAILTFAVLFGVSSLVVSPELTDIFVDDQQMEQMAELRQKEQNTSNSPSNSPENMLKQTGWEWRSFSDHERLTFAVHLAKGLKEKDIPIEAPNQIIEKIDHYYESNPKDETIEKAIMVLIAEDRFTD
ncbi:hypothetical protein [Pseudalkalibacillus salsuginis]|uniref:hypothetical protein n=1 Tax=Pseudalkalibacillus salsuginis TaxID=2910972 RepID=UPI001F44A285|nr:hypothetical protein [Pseudalkalibacillus salsuginis]MCF6409261.1 hypothetical protein [Pseudalkalibacillus salsuginis]